MEVLKNQREKVSSSLSAGLGGLLGSAKNAHKVPKVAKVLASADPVRQSEVELEEEEDGKCTPPLSPKGRKLVHSFARLVQILSPRGKVSSAVSVWWPMCCVSVHVRVVFG